MKDVENAVVEFTNYAAKNVFKMQLAKYSFEFKKKNGTHVKLLADSQPEIHKQIESVLSEKINYYLQAFWQKCLALNTSFLWDEART
jgi:hypothetical protein